MEYWIKRQIPHICIMFWTFSESSEITWFSFKASNSKQLTLADHFPFAQHSLEHVHVIISDQAVLSKNGCHGTSLAVQWLILCAYIAWGTGSIPGQGIKIPHAARYDQIKQKITKTNGCKNTSHPPCSSCDTMSPFFSFHSKRSHRNEKPTHCNKV